MVSTNGLDEDNFFLCPIWHFTLLNQGYIWQLSPSISSLKDCNSLSTKSCGFDQLDSYIIKLARPYVVPAIKHIVNTSLTTITFPKAWKVSKIVPLYKGSGKRSSPASWRPVSLLPILSKCLKRCIHNQIVAYMDGNKYFHPNQHAYRTHHSTTTAMLTMQCTTPG